ncbi:HAD family hydrolase [Bacteroidota bacterium]
MKKFDGIIFDIDATLTSTNDLIFASFNHVSEKYLNRRFTFEEIAAMFGPTEDGILTDLMGENFNAARKDYFEFYSGMHEELADIYEGIKDILEMIKKENILLSVYTGKGRKSSLITLVKIGVLEYFDMIVTGDDVKNPKPSPEGIDVFVEKFNLERNRVLMVGDSPADIKAARHAGVKNAEVLWDEYAKQRSHDLKSDFVFHTVKELDEFIKKNIS